MPYGYLAAIDEGRPSPLRWCSSWADGPGLHEKEQPRKPGGSSVSSWFLSPGCCLGSPQVAFGQCFSTATGNRMTRDKVSSGRDLQPLFTPLSHGSPLLAVWSTPFPVSVCLPPLPSVLVWQPTCPSRWARTLLLCFRRGLTGPSWFQAHDCSHGCLWTPDSPAPILPQSPGVTSMCHHTWLVRQCFQQLYPIPQQTYTACCSSLVDESLGLFLIKCD